MSDNAQEPTMEEILASIRRIISEDDAPAAEGAPAADAAAEPEPAPEPELEPEPVAFSAPEPPPEPEPIAFEAEDDDVLELTDPIEPEPASTLGDLDVFTRDEPKAPTPRPAPVSFAPEPDEPEDSLVSAAAGGLAASYFGNLSRTLSMPSEGRTLEDLVAELIRPMLKEWLDQHLPSIVEAKVQAEVERVARRR
jgi:cell pole-organizing protein PopZ